MTRWLRIFAVIGAMVVSLTGCVAPPGYGYAQTSVVVGGPQVAFRFSDGVEGYYDTAYGTYVYGDGGYYYRWVGSSWVYTNYYGGPWTPVVGAVYLPPLLIYGPPPPVVAYRPYFVWWRLHAAPWYAVNHPRWWYRHRFYVRHYALWHEHVVKFYENHPGRGLGMRPMFRHRDQRFDRMQRHGQVQRRQDDQRYRRQPYGRPPEGRRRPVRDGHHPGRDRRSHRRERDNNPRRP